MNLNTVQTFFQALIAFGSMLAIIGGFGSYCIGKKIEQKKEEKSRYVGTIESQTKIIFSLAKNIIPNIKIGDKGPIFHGDFSWFKRLGLEVKFINNQIKVSASVRDYTGNMLTTIVDNEWKVNPNKVFDRNYSKNAVEVKDNNGNIVLQVRFSGDVLQFQGVLYDPKNNLSWLVAQRERDDRMDAFMEIQKPGGNFTYSIKPIFKYPSDLHLGEYVDK